MAGPTPDEDTGAKGPVTRPKRGETPRKQGFLSISLQEVSTETSWDTGRVRSPPTTFRPQAKKYRAVNILSLNGETNGERSRSPFLFETSEG